ncbi:MAG: amino acid ABC transporter permease [Fibrobacter sp.]|nr:amino acid ABC transporter permease [Fibrobacter sp.]
MDIINRIYANLIAGGAWLTIAHGLWATVKISVLSILLGTLLGALVCAMRTSSFKPLNWFARFYIAVLRGSPVLMLLMLLYYVVFAKSSLDAESIAVVTFSLNTAAYVAELMRSALSATDHGQVEAARTLGFSKFEAFRLITLPQAAHIAKPVYQSTIVNLVQWTSVVGYVTITDLTRVINNIAARTMQPFFMIVTGMLLYLALSYCVYTLFTISNRRERGVEK